MKAMVLFIKDCCSGSKLIFDRKIKPFRIFSSRALLELPSSHFKGNQVSFCDDCVGVDDNEHGQDVLPSDTCISAESTESHDKTSLGLRGNNVFQFVNDKNYSMHGFHLKAEDADKLRRIKFILKTHGWNLGYEKNSYSEIDLDQRSII